MTVLYILRIPVYLAIHDSAQVTPRHLLVLCDLSKNESVSVNHPLIYQPSLPGSGKILHQDASGFIEEVQPRGTTEKAEHDIYEHAPHSET